MTRRRALFVSGCALLAAAGARGAGAADGKAPTVGISVIHALRTDGGLSIDPQLRDLPQLTKDQPFVRYNVFRLLDRKELPLARGKAVAYPVIDGRTLQLTLVDVTPSSGEPRYHVRAEIAGAGKREFLKLLEVTAGPNEPFFVAGQAHAGGTLFLELAIHP